MTHSSGPKQFGAPRNQWEKRWKTRPGIPWNRRVKRVSSVRMREQSGKPKGGKLFWDGIPTLGDRWWQLKNSWNFHPYLGWRWIHLDLRIFFKWVGWNHQLVGGVEVIFWYTPRGFYSEFTPKEMMGWKTRSGFRIWDFANFSGGELLNFQGVGKDGWKCWKVWTSEGFFGFQRPEDVAFVGRGR